MKVTDERLRNISLVNRQYFFKGMIYGNWHKTLNDKDFLFVFINDPLKECETIEDTCIKISKIVE